MASPQDLLGQARAFAQDFPRDQMQPGYLWDVVDYVPMVIDAALTGRGGWQWGSTAMGGDAVAGILAPFSTGEKILVIGADNQWYEVLPTSPFTATARGAALTPAQNPVRWTDTVIAFDGNGAVVPQLLTAPGGTLTIGSSDASAPHAPLGCVFGAYIVAAGVAGNLNRTYWSYPNQPTHAWDSSSTQDTQGRITALGSLRAVILVFHPGFVERIRGTTPPSSAGAQTGDLLNEFLFDRIGCLDPKTIAYWMENVVWADQHGVHISDGAVVRNLCTQGNILYFWRNLWSLKVTAAGCTFLDYYIITIRRSDGSNYTLVCDLNRRQWFRLSNFYAQLLFASAGSVNIERAWGGMAGTNRLGLVGPMFFPTLGSVIQQDGDGTNVMPVFETPYYRLGGTGRKRTRNVYLEYDMRTATSRGVNGNSPAEWRGVFHDETELEAAMEEPPPPPAPVLQAIAPVVEVDYIFHPEDAYTSAGGMPPSTNQMRRKLPIRGAPYGVGFRVKQLLPTSATRVYKLEVEAGMMEKSRL
jgi:hypothetical protein